MNYNDILRGHSWAAKMEPCHRTIRDEQKAARRPISRQLPFNRARAVPHRW